MLSDLEESASSRRPLTHAEALRVLGCTDLVSVGLLGEAARKAHHGERVTYNQVLAVTEGVPADLGAAREVRLVGRPASFAAAAEWTASVVAVAGDVPVTGFSIVDLLELAGGDHMALAEGAALLHRAGLAAVSALPIDRVDDAAELMRAVQHGGLPVWRAVVEHAPTLVARLNLIERVADLQRETGALKSFSPLPIVDQTDTPSTGYDDVRTIAVARLVCANVPSIQVDWSYYGPKLAQVALAYGADDLDNVPAIDSIDLGHRRSPQEDIERQITAAFAVPAGRGGRFELTR